MIKKSILLCTDEEIENFGKVCFTCDNAGCTEYDETSASAQFWCMKSTLDIAQGEMMTRTCEKWELFDDF